VSLAVLASPTEAGLTDRGASDALDVVLETVAGNNHEKAQTLFESILTPSNRAWLLAGRGDLPSSAAIIASGKDVLAAIVADATYSNTVSLASLMLSARSWSDKIRDREDYEELLESEIPGINLEITLADLILMSFYSKDEEITPDQYLLSGFDPDAGADRVEELKWMVKEAQNNVDSGDDLLSLDDAAIFAAKQARAAKRAETATAGQFTEAEAAQQAAAEIDL
jgi:hypothetical protein